MPTSTTKAARSHTATKLQIAQKPRPAPAAPALVTDLQLRIRLRRIELIEKLGELRADDRVGAAEAGDKLKATLSEVGHILKDDMIDGWAGLSESIKRKLERWLTESERSLSAPRVES